MIIDQDSDANRPFAPRELDSGVSPTPTHPIGGMQGNSTDVHVQAETLVGNYLSWGQIGPSRSVN